MNVESPIALHFILQDEIYLLNKDKSQYNKAHNPIATVTETQPVSFNYLGGNKKGFLILTHYTDAEFIAEAHLTALENILKRKELAIDDIAIFNAAKHDDIVFAALASYFTPQKILFLGANALPADISPLKLNVPGQLNNITALYSFSFDEMMDSTDNKRAFWEQMKNL